MQVFIWGFWAIFIIYAFCNAYTVITGKSVLGSKISRLSRIKSGVELLGAAPLSFLGGVVLIGKQDLNNYLISSNIVLFSFILVLGGSLGEVILYFLQKHQDNITKGAR